MKPFVFGAALLAAAGLSLAGSAHAIEPVNPLPKATPPGTFNVISNVGNGIGNNVVIVNDGPAGSQTIISNVKNGIGNQVYIQNGQQVIGDPFPPQGMPLLPQMKVNEFQNGQHSGMPAMPAWMQNLMQNSMQNALPKSLRDIVGEDF
jgi:hypothetical protein